MIGKYSFNQSRKLVLGLFLTVIVSFSAQGLETSALLPQWATVEQVYKQLEHLESKSFDGFKLQTIGQSGQGRPLILAQLGAEQADRKFLLVCGQHGDENDSVQACLYLLKDLTRLSQTDAAWKARLQTVQLQILPVLNPDGLALGQRQNAAGVNLNGNWSEQWNAELHPSLQPTIRKSQGVSYRGPEPFSEPESRALRDWILKQQGLKLVVDYHTGSGSFAQGMVLYPFTYAAENRLSPAQMRLLAPLAKQQARLLSTSEQARESFVALQTHEVVPYLELAMARNIPRDYLMSALKQLPQSAQAPGSMIDWCLGVAGIPALGYEVSRPFGEITPENIADFNRYYLQLGPALHKALAAFWEQPELNS